MKRRTRTWPRAVRGMMGTGGLLALACTVTTPADLSCRNNRDCLDSEICHPDTFQCVELCTTKNDCPGKEEEKVCEALSPTNSTRICKCLADLCLPAAN